MLNEISKTIDRMENKLNIWSQRSLTIGKIIIAQSMGISNLVYSLSCATCPENLIKKSQSTIDTFIWKNGVHKVKHKALIRPLEEGGSKAPDIDEMSKALRMAWLYPLIPFEIIMEYREETHSFITPCN